MKAVASLDTTACSCDPYSTTNKRMAPAIAGQRLVSDPLRSAVTGSFGKMNSWIRRVLRYSIYTFIILY